MACERCSWETGKSFAERQLLKIRLPLSDFDSPSKIDKKSPQLSSCGRQFLLLIASASDGLPIIVNPFFDTNKVATITDAIWVFCCHLQKSAHLVIALGGEVCIVAVPPI